jgi:hypothetical protein
MAGISVLEKGIKLGFGPGMMTCRKRIEDSQKNV